MVEQQKDLSKRDILMFDKYSESDLRSCLAKKGYDMSSLNARFNTLEDLKLVMAIEFVTENIIGVENTGSDLIDIAVKKLETKMNILTKKDSKSKMISDLQDFNDQYEFF